MSVQNILKKIFTPSIYNQCIIHNQFKVRHLCNGLTTGKDFRHGSSTDILLNNFKHAPSTKSVLNAVLQHERVMNAKHTMQALRSLFSLQKAGRSELSNKEIINSKEFAKLCRKLKSHSGTFDVNETIEALKIVFYVGVPVDSTIVTVLLQLLRHNINDLSLSNLMFLEFLIRQYPKSPLTDALRIALPMVFEIQLPVKMERDNIHSLREYLFYASKNKLSKTTLDLIISNMLRCTDISDAKTALSIVWSLADLPPSPAFEPLLKKNIETLLIHLDELSFEDMDSTLSRLATKYRKEYPFFSNKVFCDAVVGHIIDNDLGFKHSVFTMRKLDKLGITNIYLIDYTTKKIEENISLGLESDMYGIYVLMKYLSKTDYRPANWDIIAEMVEHMVLPKSSSTNWLKFAAATTYLQIFNQNIMRKALNENLENIFRKRTSHIYLFLTMYYSVKLYKPQLMKLFPKQLRTKDLIQYLSIPDEFPFQGALYSAFGGETYVKNELYSKEGIFLDHAIIFRKGGYPVASNFRSTFIEDLDIPSDHQVVLIMCLTPDLYTEENHLKMCPTMSIKVLEDLGYSLVPICLSSWESLADFEKIPYLVQNIKNKLGDNIMLADSSG